MISRHFPDPTRFQLVRSADHLLLDDGHPRGHEAGQGRGPGRQAHGLPLHALPGLPATAFGRF